ncbi:MAG: type II toxin-antitoxin system Phd/YefM family antitoxin [Chloroflexia bacterium]|nr:type II toxin-antitoxin system Phd/YefM family antitoxin [Chloroflexia bacterium]
MAIRNKRASTSWSVVEAKAHFDEVIDEVEDERTQKLVRHGDERAAIVPIDEWGSREPIGNLLEFFARAGLREGELQIPPRTGSTRDLEW